MISGPKPLSERQRRLKAAAERRKTGKKLPTSYSLDRDDLGRILKISEAEQINLSEAVRRSLKAYEQMLAIKSRYTDPSSIGDQGGAETLKDHRGTEDLGKAEGSTLDRTYNEKEQVVFRFLTLCTGQLYELYSLVPLQMPSDVNRNEILKKPEGVWQLFHEAVVAKFKDLALNQNSDFLLERAWTYLFNVLSFASFLGTSPTLGFSITADRSDRVLIKASFTTYWIINTLMNDGVDVETPFQAHRLKLPPAGRVLLPGTLISPAPLSTVLPR